MKSLAIVSTQNIVTQPNGVSMSNTKAPESGDSFKQVLAQKTTSEPMHEAKSRSENDNEAQSNASAAPNSTTSAPEQQTSQVDDTAADKAELVEITPANAKGLKLRLQNDASVSSKKTKETEEAPQDESAAALVAALQLPAMGVRPVDVPMQKTETQSDSALGHDALPQAVAAHQKTASRLEGKLDQQADKIEQWDNQAAPDKNAHAMTMDSKAEKFSEQVNAKIAEKIQAFSEKQTAYAVGKSPTEASPKLAEMMTPLQMATSQAQALNEATASSVVRPAVGQSGWNEAVNQKVVWMVGAQEQTATLTLNPPDMGPLQVVVSVNNDHADTTFVTDNPEVRKALQDGLADLRSQLDQAGVTLGQANVSTNQQYQDFRQSNGEQFTQQPVANGASHASSQAVEHASARSAVVRANLGLVDTFA
jgi:flagellar hook-length control protein FliK